MATRNATGLLAAIAKSHKTITGAKFPTYGEKLRCFLFYIQHSNEQKELWPAAKEVVNPVKPHYLKYATSMLGEKQCIKQEIKYPKNQYQKRS